MSLCSRATVVILWVISLVAVAVLVSAQPQARKDPAPLITGNDIGFRPEGWRGSARTGTFFVRVNGQWVEAVDTVKTQPLTTR